MNKRPKRRSFRTLPHDVFGREYTVWIDKDSEAPVGLIERNFTEPKLCVVPQKFLTVPPQQSWRLVVDFSGYIDVLATAYAEWHANAKEWMTKLYRELGAQRAEAGDFSLDALELAGPRPQPWQLIELARRGDPWCLGFTEERTPAVVSLIGEPVPEPRRMRAKDGAPTTYLGPALEALVAHLPKQEPAFSDEDARTQYEMAPRVERVEYEDGTEEDTRLDGGYTLPEPVAPLPPDFEPPELGSTSTLAARSAGR